MLKIVHGEGFFSCCSVILSDIVLYMNQHGRLPEGVILPICSKCISQWRNSRYNI